MAACGFKKQFIHLQKSILMSRSLFFSLVVLLCFLSTVTIKAQTVVYYCKEMGAIGYAYSNPDNEKGKNEVRVLKQQAEKDCQSHGGKNCICLYETGHLGWGGIIRGSDVHGNPVVVATGGNRTRDQLVDELRREYLLSDGLETNQMLPITWQAE